jgi:hypothetical protein
MLTVFQTMSNVVGPSETTVGAVKSYVVNFYEDVITASLFPSAADALSEIQCQYFNFLFP